MTWSVEEVQQRVVAESDSALYGRRAELENLMRRRGAAGWVLGHSDGADFELVAIGQELRTRSRRTA